MYFGFCMTVGVIVIILAEVKKREYFQYMLHVFDDSLTVGFIKAVYLGQIKCNDDSDFNFGVFTGDWQLGINVMNESLILLYYH